jgi:hypothetical protein
LRRNHQADEKVSTERTALVYQGFLLDHLQPCASDQSNFVLCRQHSSALFCKRAIAVLHPSVAAHRCVIIFIRIKIAQREQKNRRTEEHKTEHRSKERMRTTQPQGG